MCLISDVMGHAPFLPYTLYAPSALYTVLFMCLISDVMGHVPFLPYTLYEPTVPCPELCANLLLFCLVLFLTCGFVDC